MDLIVDLFYSILFILLGAWIIKYRKQLHWWTWNFVWAEQYIWRWWTYFILILIWLWLLFLWAIYPFWWLDLLTKK